MRRPYIILTLVGILGVSCLFLWTCSSTFSFSWHTKKEVGKRLENTRPSENATARPVPSHLSSEKSKPTGDNGVPVHSVQILRFWGNSPTDIESFMIEMSKKGIDTIFFRVFQNPGDTLFRILPVKAKAGVYFKSSQAPIVSDLLPLVCRVAHAQGIKVYAWINTLNATYLNCYPRARHTSRYDLSLRKLVKTPRMSPFDPLVKKCLANLFADLAKNPIDGILIQDDLILHYNEDLSPVAVRQYAQETGTEKVKPGTFYVVERGKGKTFHLHGYHEAFWRWSAWKSRKLAGFLKTLIQRAKAARPNVKVALNINYEALLMPEDALAWYSRDIPTLEKIAHPDLYMVMSYQKQMARELEKPYPVIIEDLKKMVRTAVGLIPPPGRWIFKVQTVDWKTGHPLKTEQIVKAATAIVSVSPVKTCLMPYVPFLLREVLREKKLWTESVRGISRQTSKN